MSPPKPFTYTHFCSHLIVQLTYSTTISVGGYFIVLSVQHSYSLRTTHIFFLTHAHDDFHHLNCRSTQFSFYFPSISAQYHAEPLLGGGIKLARRFLFGRYALIGACLVTDFVLARDRANSTSSMVGRSEGVWDQQFLISLVITVGQPSFNTGRNPSMNTVRSNSRDVLMLANGLDREQSSHRRIPNEYTSAGRL